MGLFFSLMSDGSLFLRGVSRAASRHYSRGCVRLWLTNTKCATPSHKKGTIAECDCLLPRQNFHSLAMRHKIREAFDLIDHVWREKCPYRKRPTELLYDREG